MMRIASNLVSNAIKYTHEGSVSFGLKMQNDKVWLEVQDTGLGMKPDEFKIALGRHVRLKQDANQVEGNGFGLVIVKHLADTHGIELSLCPKQQAGTSIRAEFNPQ